MKKRIFSVLVCVVLLFTAIVMTACANETDALNARITALENENAELKTTVSSLRTDLDSANAGLSNSQNEVLILQTLIASLEEQASQNGDQNGALAITYGGEPNKDMSWPLSYGELPLGVRGDILDDESEIVWRSTNEDIFTVAPSDDGTSAIVTPLTTGSAEMVVTVGDQETRSWVRVT